MATETQIASIRNLIKGNVVEMAKALAEQKGCDGAMVILLTGILVKLQELIDVNELGTRRFDIRAISLGSVPIKILDRDPSSQGREVSIWLDPASGGPTPVVKISTSGAGGFRVNAGEVSELGRVPAETELWGVCTNTTISGVLIERV